MASLEAYEKFIANEPEGEIEFRTIEAYSPSFGVVRFVADFVEQNFTLESEAPRNGGENVIFEAATLRITEPAERDDGEQQLSINLGGADARLNELIESIQGSNFLTPVEIIYRKYYSGDLSEPAITPLYLQISTISFDNIEQITIIAEDSNLAKRRPGSYYIINNFPGLA